MTDTTLNTKVSLDTKDFDLGMEKIQKSLKHVSSSIASFRNTTSNAVKGVSSSFKKCGSAFTSFGIQLSANVESMNNFFSSMHMLSNSSGEIGTSLLSNMGVLNDFGIAVKDTADYMDAANGMIAVFGGNVQTIETIANAFTKFAVAGSIIESLGQGLSNAGLILDSFQSNMSTIGNFVISFAQLIAPTKEINGCFQALKTIFSSFMTPMGAMMIGITALVALFGFLLTSNDDFRNSFLTTMSEMMSAIQPCIQQIGAALLPLLQSIISVLLPTLNSILIGFAPILLQIVDVIAMMMVMLAPIIAQLITQLAPVITMIVTTLSQIIQAVAPVLITLLGVIIDIVQSLVPIMMQVLGVAVTIFSSIVAGLSPIIAFIGELITNIMSVVSPIISFISGVIHTIITIITSIFDVVSSVFSGIGTFISDIFSGIENNWNGLSAFAEGITSGIATLIQDMIGGVKGLVNVVVSGINGAIDLINMIPGIDIASIPYLLHGADRWQGGFAYMNEGGRGELTYLPNGTQVIPHDISVQYAKEAARIAYTQADTQGIVYEYNYSPTYYSPKNISAAESARLARKDMQKLLSGVSK